MSDDILLWCKICLKHGAEFKVDPNSLNTRFWLYDSWPVSQGANQGNWQPINSTSDLMIALGY